MVNIWLILSWKHMETPDDLELHLICSRTSCAQSAELWNRKGSESACSFGPQNSTLPKRFPYATTFAPNMS